MKRLVALVLALLIPLSSAGAAGIAASRFPDGDTISGVFSGVQSWVPEAEFDPYLRGGVAGLSSDLGEDALGFANLRLMVSGDVGSSGDFEFHLFSTARTASDSAFRLAAARAGNGRYRAVDLAWDDRPSENTDLLALIDRANVRLTLGPADITLGRQAITFGKAYFWNPLDIFRPFRAEQVNRDYKAGVDALRVDFALGDFSGLSFVGAAGREVDLTGHPALRGGASVADFALDRRDAHIDWTGSALLARVYSSIGGWDVAVQSGKVYGGNLWGGAAVGELGPVQVRVEGAWLEASDSPFLANGEALFEDHLELVAGLGRRFDNGLQADMEYLFNDGGGADDLTNALRLAGEATLQAGRHLMGARASYEIMPVLTGSLVGIVSLSDSSAIAQAHLVFSVSDNADLLATANVTTGRGADVLIGGGLLPRSEFGAAPDFLTLEYKQFF